VWPGRANSPGVGSVRFGPEGRRGGADRDLPRGMTEKGHGPGFCSTSPQQSSFWGVWGARCFGGTPPEPVTRRLGGALARGLGPEGGARSSWGGNLYSPVNAGGQELGLAGDWVLARDEKGSPGLRR